MDSLKAKEGFQGAPLKKHGAGAPFLKRQVRTGENERHTAVKVKDGNTAFRIRACAQRPWPRRSASRARSCALQGAHGR